MGEQDLSLTEHSGLHYLQTYALGTAGQMSMHSVGLQNFGASVHGDQRPVVSLTHERMPVVVAAAAAVLEAAGRCR